MEYELMPSIPFHRMLNIISGFIFADADDGGMRL